MKQILKTIPLLALGLLFMPLVGHAQTGSPTGTTAVSVTIGPQAGLNITNSATPLTANGSNFNQFIGSTGLTYYVRTTATGGGGSITLKVTSDFSPAGGPSVASPPSAGDGLIYTCTVQSPGTACSGTQTSSTTSQTNVATFAANVHSAAGGNTASVAWSLANDPSYKTGTYTSTVTFTISAS
jgi:hypothetical protein